MAACTSSIRVYRDLVGATAAARSRLAPWFDGRHSGQRIAVLLTELSAAICVTLSVVTEIENMSFRAQRESDLPLLVVVEQWGATANPLDVYPLLAAQFSELSADPQGR